MSISVLATTTAISNKFMTRNLVLLLVLVLVLSVAGRSAEPIQTTCDACITKCYGTQAPSVMKIVASLCMRKCSIDCKKKFEEHMVPHADSISREDFEHMAHAAAMDLVDELLDGHELAKKAAKIDNACSKCKKQCEVTKEGYKCYANCANRSICQYEDNTVAVVV